MHGFYFITDAGLSRHGLAYDVQTAAASGCVLIQYRVSDLGGHPPPDSRQLFAEADQLRRLAGSVPFIVNDRLDIALAVGADGVHLGQSDLPVRIARRLLGPRALIGASVATVEEALAAEAQGASYLGVGPIFATGTKTGARPGIGLAGLSAIRAATTLPLAAIGGINLERSAACVAAGANMVCAIAAVLQAPDLQQAIKQFKETIQ